MAQTSAQKSGGQSESERVARKALTKILEKGGQFEGKDVTKYLREYATMMEAYGAEEKDMLSLFPTAVIQELREQDDARVR